MKKNKYKQNVEPSGFWNSFDNVLSIIDDYSGIVVFIILILLFHFIGLDIGSNIIISGIITFLFCIFS